MQKGLYGAICALRSAGASPTGINEKKWQQEPAGKILWKGPCRNGHALLTKGAQKADSYEVETNQKSHS